MNEQQICCKQSQKKSEVHSPHNIPSIQFQFIDNSYSNLTKNQYQILKKIHHRQQSHYNHQNLSSSPLKPKNKISSIVQKLKQNKMIEHFQKEKRQQLKEQWKAFQKQKGHLKINLKFSNCQKDNTNNLTLTINNSINSSLNDDASNVPKQLKDKDHNKLYSHDNISQNNLNKNGENKKILDIKKLQNIRNKHSIFLSQDKKHQKNYAKSIYKFQNDKKVQNKSQKNINKAINTNYPFKKCLILDNHNKKDQKLQFVYKNLSDSPQKPMKSFSQQIYQVCQTQYANNDKTDGHFHNRRASVSLPTQNDQYKLLNQTMKKVNNIKINPNKTLYYSKKKSHINMSKSVMVQKIINLRKSFNEKFRKEPKLHNQTGINQRIKQGQYYNSQNQLISVVSAQNLTLTQFELGQKISAYELFLNEKRKMQLLKQFVSQRNFTTSIHNYNSFYQHEPNNKVKTQKQQFETIQQQDKVINLAQFIKQNSETTNSLLIQQISSICQTPVLLDQKKYGSPTPSSSPQPFYQRGHSLPNVQSHPHIITYNFEEVHKNKTQTRAIKELRHKYLHSNHNNQQSTPKTQNKKGYSKQECHKYGISIVTVHDTNSNNNDLFYSNSRQRSLTQPLTNQILQIQKKSSYKNKKQIYKITANFQKLKFNSTNCNFILNKQDETEKIHSRHTNNYENFEPWQDDKMEHYQIQDLKTYGNGMQQ